jgi:hypothetical protein
MNVYMFTRPRVNQNRIGVSFSLRFFSVCVNVDTASCSGCEQVVSVANSTTIDVFDTRCNLWDGGFE